MYASSIQFFTKGLECVCAFVSTGVLEPIPSGYYVYMCKHICVVTTKNQNMLISLY